MEKLILGISGGVDSSLAAELLRAGYDVTGVYLDTGSGSPDAAMDTARTLGIPLLIRNVRAAFEQEVVEPFCRAYMEGLTPNPCVMCNRRVKLRMLFDTADEIGARTVATGHYARIVEFEDAPALAMAKTKDQSYMLWAIEPEWIARLVLPLGDIVSKEAVREHARKLGLSSADTADSQDICFIPDGDYGGFLERRGMALPEGDIVDPDGRVLGRHRGLQRYTVGQRRGLGVAAGDRVYVAELDRVHNRVVLARGDVLLTDTVEVRGARYLREVPERFSGMVKLRLGMKAAACEVTRTADGFTLRLAEAVRQPAPGQSAVVYTEAGVLLCGGMIER
jgi:tRNA-specific 2-thiouridylase